MDKQVGIVVVTYNRLNLLIEVIDSLRKQSFNDFQIIVINNGSTDGTKEWLLQQKDIITISQANLGGAGGFFTGMKYVAEKGYEYCWVMDDDVICEIDTLSELYKAINRNEIIGFTCSNVLGTDGSPMNTPMIDIETRSPVTGYRDYFNMSDYNMVRVKMATFVSVLIRCRVIYELGLPIREYFIWGDDSEFTTRISKRYPCYVALASKVIHKRSIQKALLFEEETDKKRIAFYIFKYRNEAYTQILRKEKKRIVILLSLLALSIKLFIYGKINHSKVISIATKQLMFFKPIIEYPNSTGPN